MREVAYNSQRDNYTFGGKFKAWSQCFSTSVWMLICFWLKRPCDDYGLAEYVSEVEMMVGTGRIAKKVVAYARWITGFTSFWWLVQKAGIEDRLSGLKGEVIFRDATGTWDEVSQALRKGPVVIATDKLPGIKGGHIVLIVDETKNEWIVHDPFGDARSAYVIADGANRAYGKEWFRQYTENVTGQIGKIRIMYFQKRSKQ